MYFVTVILKKLQFPIKTKRQRIYPMIVTQKISKSFQVNQKKFLTSLKAVTVFPQIIVLLYKFAKFHSLCPNGRKNFKSF